MNTTRVCLRRLFPDAELLDGPDSPVSRVVADSRQVRPGDVFVAIKGTQTDGHDHIPAAIAAGASVIMTSRRIPGLPVAQCVVACTSSAFARLTMHLELGGIATKTVAGITGTNGKTTTTWILRSILQAAGLQTGLIGTIQNSDGLNSEPASMTTPPADELARRFRQMKDCGTSHCVMEISSHALVQKRCDGLRLSAAAITNITQDHFDYHHSSDAYLQAKMQIAQLLHMDAPLLLNIADAGCREVAKRVGDSAVVVTCGVDHPGAELQANLLSRTHRSQRILLRLAQGDAQVRLRLVGRHNVENCLIAAGLAEQLGVRLKDIVQGLESLTAVPGRLERIDEGQNFQVLVDYAHTPDALARCLETVTEFAPGRVICVFGAGGERDRAKRPLMGRAAAAADIALVTSDNPRSEDPQQIIREVVAGFSHNQLYETEVAREKAIARAVELAEPGDVVLIAGKGHEGTQQIGNRMFPFDDREVVRRLLRQWNSGMGVPALTHGSEQTYERHQKTQ